MAYPKRPSENLIFRELFDSVSSVVDNEGTLINSPSVSNGVTLNGTNQYVSYSVTGEFFNNSPEITLEVWFNPDFNYDEDAARTIVSSSPNAYMLQKRNNAENNVILLYLANQLIAAIPQAAYSSNWNQNGLNHMVVCGANGDTDVYLNNNQVVTADNSAWTPASVTGIEIGATDTPLNYFDGIIYQYSIYNRKLESNEVSDLYNSGRGLYEETTTYQEIDQSRSLSDLPLITNYTSGGNQITDNKGTIGTTAKLGDGSTASTFPTQLTPHGMSFDGGDYIDLSDDVASADGLTTGAVSLWFKTSSSALQSLWSVTDTASANNYADIMLNNVTGDYADESLEFLVNGDGGVTHTMFVRNGDGFYSDDRWHHVVVSVNGVDNFIMVDGEDQAITFGAGSATSTHFTNITSADKYHLGVRERNAGKGNYLSGSLARPKMFGTGGLTKTQAKAIYLKELRSING